MDEDTATESETESESVELGPGDSVSQRLIPAPVPPQTVKAKIPHAPCPASHLATPKYIQVDTDTATISDSDESDSASDSEFDSGHPKKRLRLALPPDPLSTSPPASHPSAPVLSLAPSSVAQCLAECANRPEHEAHQPQSSASSARPAPLITPAGTQETHTAPVLPTFPTTTPLQPPSTPDLAAVLAWVARLAQQVTGSPAVVDQGAGTSTQITPTAQSDSAYDSLIKVLQDIGCHDDALLPGAVAFGPRASMQSSSHSNHIDLVEDNAEALEAQAALALG